MPPIGPNISSTSLLTIRFKRLVGSGSAFESDERARSFNLERMGYDGY